MIRREFLKVFSAFGAAVAAGVRMPTGRDVQAAAPPEPTPALVKPAGVAVAQATAARSMQDEVIAKLAECVVTGIERISYVEGFDRYRITYLLDKATSPHSAGLNAEAAPLVKDRRPVSITVHCRMRDVDVLDLGSFGKSLFEPIAPVYEIEVIWA